MNQIKRYLFAMNATALQSAVHALKLFCGAAGIHQVYDAVPMMDIRLGAVVFLIAFGNAILEYIDAHPLPVEIPSSPATPATPATH